MPKQDTDRDVLLYAHQTLEAFKPAALKSMGLDVLAHKVDAALKRPDTLANIHAELDGTEWDADLMSVVASHLIAAGYKIRDPNEEESDAD